MGLVRTKILALPRPLEQTLTDIAKDLNVSRQYVHQIVTTERISQYRRKRPLCKGCGKNEANGYKRRYCPDCISQDLHNKNKRTGKEFKCYRCGIMVYRKPSHIKRMKPNGKSYCYDCYMFNR